jgi:hypothetical protein
MGMVLIQNAAPKQIMGGFLSICPKREIIGLVFEDARVSLLWKTNAKTS